MKRVLLALLCACALFIARPALAQYAVLEDLPYSPSLGAGLVYLNGDNSEGQNADQWYLTVNGQIETDQYVLNAFFGTDPQAGGFIYGALADYIVSQSDGTLIKSATPGYWLGAGAALVGFTDLYPSDTGDTMCQLDFGPNVTLGFEYNTWKINLGASYLLDTQNTMLSATVNIPTS